MCAISGVWLLDRNEPLLSKKLSRFGIICRSDGTFGLSRKKWTLSNVSSTTCLTPLPSWQPVFVLAAAVCAGALAAARAGPAVPAAVTPPSRDRQPASAAIRPESVLTGRVPSLVFSFAVGGAVAWVPPLPPADAAGHSPIFEPER